MTTATNTVRRHRNGRGNPAPVPQTRPRKAGCIAIALKNGRPCALWVKPRWTRVGFAPLIHRILAKGAPCSTAQYCADCTVPELELIAEGVTAILESALVPESWRSNADGTPIVAATRRMQAEYAKAMPWVFAELDSRIKARKLRSNTQYGLPKGSIDANEGAWAAARREFSEETGVDVDAIARVAEAAPVYHAKSRTILYVVTLPAALVDQPGWDVANPETSGTKWLTASQIAKVVTGSTAITMEKELFGAGGPGLNALLSAAKPPADRTAKKRRRRGRRQV